MRPARSPAWSWRATICPGDLAERARRMSKAYEDYTQLRVLQAAARRRLRVVLRDGDAAHSRRLDVDGPVSREAHHAAGADALGGRQGDRRRSLRSPHRARGQRRIRLDGRSLQRHGGRSGAEPPPPRARQPRSRAEARRGRRPAPLHRGDPRADRHRRGVDRSRRPHRHHQSVGAAAARTDRTK